jgi:CBS domain-containing protein
MIYAKDLMHEPTFVGGDASVRDAAVLMREKSIGSVLVESSSGWGILTERDIVKKVVSRGVDPSVVCASEIMTCPLITCPPDADIYRIAGVFCENSIRRLPVEDDGKILGVLTTRDVTRSLLPEFFKDHPEFRKIKEYRKKG